MNLLRFCINILFLLLVAHSVSASIPLAPRMGAGGKMDMFGCMLSNDFYIANFAAYQTDPQQPKAVNALLFPMCQEIPKTGDTKITVDMLDRDVRKKPVSLKVFDSEQHVIAETPSIIVKQGYVSTNVNFPKPGHYDLVVYVEDHDLNIVPQKSALHIPLTVALVVPGPSVSAGNIIAIIVGIGALAFLIGFLVPRLMKPKAEVAV